VRAVHLLSDRRADTATDATSHARTDVLPDARADFIPNATTNGCPIDGPDERALTATDTAPVFRQLAWLRQIPGRYLLPHC
jgi:hypothetical protein